MGRIQGTLSIAGNFEPKAAAPFDARGWVETIYDLTGASTFNGYEYSGMPVSVYGDTEENNGLWLLKKQPCTDWSNWARVGRDYSTEISGLTSAFANYMPLSGGSFSGKVTFNSGATFNTLTAGTLSVTTISGGTFYGDGSKLTGISTTDYYTSAATLNDTLITFSGNNSASTYTLSLSGFSKTNHTHSAFTNNVTFNSGATFNTLSATTISGGTFYGSGLGISDLVPYSGANTMVNLNSQSILQTLPSSGNSYVGLFTTAICGELISEGQVCVPDLGGKIYVSFNTASSRIPGIYIATTSGDTGSTITVLKSGVVRNTGYSALTAGADVWVGVNGKPTTIEPDADGTVKQKIGVALSSTTFEFIPSMYSTDESELKLREQSSAKSLTTNYIKAWATTNGQLKSINDSGYIHWLNAINEHSINPTLGDTLIFDGLKGFNAQSVEVDDTFIKVSETNISADGILTVTIPAGYEIYSIYCEEINNAAAGDIKLSSTSAYTGDIVGLTSVSAMFDNKLVVIKGYFSKNNDTSVYISSTSFGTAIINLYFTFIKTR